MSVKRVPLNPITEKESKSSKREDIPWGLAYSPSKFGDYDKCPKYYQLKRIKKIKIDTPPNPWTNFGVQMHEYAELLGEPDFDSRQFLIDLMKDETLNDEYRAKVIPSAHNIKRYLDNLKASLSEGDKIFKEEIIHFPTDYNYYYGIVDLLIQFSNGKYKVTDYKTALKIKAKEKYFFQMKYYQAMLMQHLGAKAEDVSFSIYFTSLDKELEFSFTKEEIDAHIQEQRDKIIEINDPNNKYRPRFTPLCPYCEYSRTEHCPNSVLFVTAKNKK